MATPSAMRLGLRLASHRPGLASASFFTPSIAVPKRALSSTTISQTTRPLLQRSKFSALAANAPQAPSPPSLLLTQSVNRVRNASTTTTTPQPASPANTTASTVSAQPMNWNSFFTLRTSRRRYSLISSLLGSFSFTALSMYALVEYQDRAESILKLIPTDPFVSTGIAVMAATFLGWLLGPVVGNSLWRIVYRRGQTQFVQKEKAFYERIKKHRVNPSGAGANNPVPDFYGEKIGSVQNYRRWLKDQRAFNRKRGVNYPATI